MSLKRNLAASYLGQIWVGIVGVAFLPLYVRYLGNEALGLIGVFALMQAWLTLLDLGITPTLNREMARFTAGGHSAQSIADLMRSLEVVGSILATFIALALWAASGYVAANWLQARALPIDVVRQAVAVMGLVIALRFVEGIYRGALLGLQRQVFYNAVNVVMTTARFMGAAAIVAFVSPTIRAFYLWQAAVSIIAVATLALAVHRSLPETPAPPRVSPAALGEVRQFAGGMLVITWLALLVTQVDKLLLSRLLPLEQFGYYTLAATMAGGLNMLVVPILQAIYPRLVEEATSGNRSGLAKTYHTGAQLVAVTTAPAMLLLAVFPGGVVYAWSGNAHLAAETAPLLLPLALGSFLNVLLWMPSHSQFAHGWTGLTIRVSTVGVLVLVPAILWLVPRHGALAAGWIWVTFNLAYVTIAVQFMHRRILIEEKWDWYLADIAAPVGGAAIVALLVAPLAPAPAENRLVWAIYLGVVGVVTMVTAISFSNSLRPRALLLLRRLVYSGAA